VSARNGDVADLAQRVDEWNERVSRTVMGDGSVQVMAEIESLLVPDCLE
jgi:hypothetical protein